MEQLKRLRAAKGLSQAKLAARAGLDPSTVNQIERGAREASPPTLRKLADALDVSIADLLESEAPKVLAPQPDPPGSARFDLDRFIQMDMEEFGQYAAALDDEALQRLVERIDEEALRQYSPDLKAVERLKIRRFVASLDLQVRKQEAAPEQLAAVLAAVA